MPTKLETKREQYKAKSDELAKVFDEAGDDLDMDSVKTIDGDSSAKVDWIKARNTELSDLFDEIKTLETLQAGRDQSEAAAAYLEAVKANRGLGVLPQDFMNSLGIKMTETRSIEDMLTGFLESEAISQKGREFTDPDFDMKTLFATSAGWAPETTRGPRVVDAVAFQPRVVDVVPQSTTTQAAIKYMQEQAFTIDATEVAEGGTKPEATLSLAEVIDPVQKIAVWIPVTDEQLEDVPQARSYIERRLGFMVRRRLSGQILNGDGISPNLEGILNRAGLQTQAKGADPTPDAVYKAITKVEVTGDAMADTVIFHPNDWQEVRLLRTADGIYIWGSPADPGPARIWGLPVVKAQEIGEGTALVGDFGNFSELAVRSGVTLAISDSDSTNFRENKQTVRAEMRAALVVYRPAAFCSVTGV